MGLRPHLRAHDGAGEGRLVNCETGKDAFRQGWRWGCLNGRSLFARRAAIERDAGNELAGKEGGGGVAPLNNQHIVANQDAADIREGGV